MCVCVCALIGRYVDIQINQYIYIEREVAKEAALVERDAARYTDVDVDAYI